MGKQRGIKKMKRRKILYISHCGGGGAPKSLVLLLKSLDKSKYDPVVLLRKFGSAIEGFFKRECVKTYIKNLSVFGVNTHSPKLSAIGILDFLIYFLPNIIEVYRIIKNENIDLVYINSSVFITPGVASWLAGVKVVWHIREVIPDSKIGKLEKRLIEFISSDIIAISKEVQKQFDKRKTILIYNGINPEEFKPNSEKEVIRKKYGLNDEETIFTHIGQLSPAKGSFIFLKAARILIEAGYKVRFWVIGGHSGNSTNDFTTRIKNVVKHLLRHKDCKEELEKFARDLAIADKIIFTGYRDDVPNFISLSDAIVAPNLQPEGFGRVLIEAGALRKPVISTDIPPTSEIVIDGKTGILVEPKSPEALAEAMIYIINNPREARKMGENGYQNVVNNFHIDVTHSKIADLYGKILSR